MTIGGELVEFVPSFTYLGSIISADGSIQTEITSRIGKTADAMKKLSNVLWKRISRQTKLRMYRALVAYVLLYGSETWNPTTRDCNRLNEFDMSCLRRLENVKWYHHVRNITIRQQTTASRLKTLTQCRLRWFGHLQRMPPESEVLKLHNFSPGTIGWIRQRWLNCVSEDLAVIDLPLAEAVRIAHHRIAWRAVLCRVTSMLDDQQEL